MKKSPVQPKKHLGQHFLTDLSIAQQIANTLSEVGYDKVLEIGPGTGVLTQFLLGKNIEVFVIEIDTESVTYLEQHFSKLKGQIRDFVPEFSGMFQKEVAERICEKAGSKTYGILSVLTQAFYDTEYLFTVSEHVFNPPPKVKSGVIRLKRKENYGLPCEEKLFFQIVKTAFGQRRKTLRNSLKSFLIEKESLKSDPLFDKRPEMLSVEEFITLAQWLA